MKLRFLFLTIVCAAAILLNAACAAQATPPVDSMATTVAQLAYEMMTGTASRASPTPTDTRTPTATPTQTATITPTSPPPRPPLVVNFAGCWRGPGPSYVLVSNINKGTRVDLKGIGSVPGWYIIINPYFHQLCWIQAVNLSIHAGTDMSKYPEMTPSPLTPTPVD